MATVNDLLPALVQQESAGDPNALSPKGAAGLYQIMPETARDPGYGVTPLQGWDGKDPRTATPEEQRRFATDYLGAMAALHGGDVKLALASYNAGPGAVQAAGNTVPNYAETQGYVKNITNNTPGVQNVATTTVSPDNVATDWRTRAQAVENSYQAPAPAQVPAATDWRSRAESVQPQNSPAAEVGSWRTRAQAVEAPKPEAPSYAQRLGADLEKRGKQGWEAIDAYKRGEQTGVEAAFQVLGKAGAGTIADVVGTTIGSAYRNLVPGVVQRNISAAGDYVADSAVGDVAKDYAGTVGKKYGEFAEAHPRAARNVEAGADIVSLLPIGKAAKVAAPVVGDTGKTALSLGAKLSDKLGESSVPRPRTPKPELGAQATALKEQASAAFKQAEELGQTFQAADIANPLRKEIDALKPKPINGVLTTEEKKLVSHLSEYDKLDGANLSLDDIKRLDEGLTQKINDNFVDPRTGQVNASGRVLTQLQTKLRNIVDAVPENPGYDALSNGRRLWKGQIMLNELDTIAERASMTKNPGDALRTGYKNLYMDKDRIRGWPQEAKDLLKKAATPTVTDDVLGLVASRLPAMIMGGTGNFAGATTAHLAGVAGRGLKAGLAARSGSKIQNFIVNDTKAGLREVKPKAPPKQLLLAAPDKMSKLGMTDKEISIAQKLGARTAPTKPDLSGGAIQVPGTPDQLPMKLLPSPDKVSKLPNPAMTDQQVTIAQKLGAKAAATGDDLSGSAVRTPVSYRNQLKESLQGIKAGQYRNLEAKLLKGEISQNKFVETAGKAFNLKTSQARALAKEIKTYGDK